MLQVTLRTQTRIYDGCGRKKFGYDPNDPISFPIETYFLDENSTKSEVARKHQVLLSDSNRFYYKLKDFHKFGNNDPAKHQELRDFLTKVMPILYNRLGVPVEEIICEITCVGSRCLVFN